MTGQARPDHRQRPLGIDRYIRPGIQPRRPVLNELHDTGVFRMGGQPGGHDRRLGRRAFAGEEAREGIPPGVGRLVGGEQRLVRKVGHALETR